MVEDEAFSHKNRLCYYFQGILNPEGNQNCNTGSKVTAILLNGWIFPIGGASAMKGMGLRLVFYSETISGFCLLVE